MRVAVSRRLQVNSQSTIRALAKISFGSDGRVDPSTVGPEVRALARAYIGGHPDAILDIYRSFIFCKSLILQVRK